MEIESVCEVVFEKKDYLLNATQLHNDDESEIDDTEKMIMIIGKIIIIIFSFSVSYRQVKEQKREGYDEVFADEKVTICSF